MFGDKVKDIVFSCVPASSAEKNELRYKEFSARVCELSGTVDAYQHVSVTGERLTVHEHRKDKEKTVSKVRIIDFDEAFFKGKDVLCFDDILTTGTVGRHMVANWNNLEPISWVVSFLARQLIR